MPGKLRALKEFQLILMFAKVESECPPIHTLVRLSICSSVLPSIGKSIHPSILHSSIHFFSELSLSPAHVLGLITAHHWGSEIKNKIKQNEITQFLCPWSS